MQPKQNNALKRFANRFRTGRMTRFGAALALSASLSGCMTAQTATTHMFSPDCMADRADIVAGVNWDEVQPYRMRIVDGEFRPMIFNVERDRPYVLVLENADDKDHDFWAPDFLKSGVALDSIQFGDQAPAKGCVNGVRIKARSQVVIRFVPVWEGRYEVRNVNFILTPTIGATVIMHIVPPRVGTAVN